MKRNANHDVVRTQMGNKESNYKTFLGIAALGDSYRQEVSKRMRNAIKEESDVKTGWFKYRYGGNSEGPTLSYNYVVH